MVLSRYSEIFPWINLNTTNNWNWQATTVAATILGSLLYYIGNKRQKKTLKKATDQTKHSIEIDVHFLIFF